MGFKTRFLNIFRRISMIPAIERLLASRILDGSTIAKKLIADIALYPKHSLRNCTRNHINYQLDISDYMEHAIYFGIDNTVDFDRRILYSLIKDDFICLDIGANIGETTLNFAQRARKGKVFSFEPVPFLFERLQKNLSLNNFDNIFAFNLAISDKEEDLFFEKPANNNSAGISLSKEKTSTASLVRAVSLDSFVSHHSIEKIDLIKIDVEGFEHFVINGAKETLKRFKPIVILEIDNSHLSKNNSSEKQLLSVMQNEFGCTLYRIDGATKNKITRIENTNEHYDVICIPE